MSVYDRAEIGVVEPVGGRSSVSYGRDGTNGTKIPVPLERKIHAMREPEKCSRTSRSSDHPDAIPVNVIIRWLMARFGAKDN